MLGQNRRPDHPPPFTERRDVTRNCPIDSSCVPSFSSLLFFLLPPSTFFINPVSRGSTSKRLSKVQVGGKRNRSLPVLSLSLSLDSRLLLAQQHNGSGIVTVARATSLVSQRALGFLTLVFAIPRHPFLSFFICHTLRRKAYARRERSV